jgi:preprotein translocase subunit SecA
MLFRKKKTRRQDDKIWATKTLRLNGICDEILKEMDRSYMVMILAHFERTLEELKEALDARGLKYKLFKENWDISDFDLDGIKQEGFEIVILLSDVVSSLGQFGDSSKQASSRKRRVHIVIVEHHPLPERDEVVLSLAAHLPYVTTIRFHASLDEPLMTLFGADRLASMLTRLGRSETSPVIHPMITSAIATAQKKIEKDAIGDERVESAEDWFYYNFPPSRGRMR